jgi:hypothetical protein
MDLNAQQYDAINFQLGQLLVYDEPAAFLATLQRIADRKAYGAAKARDYGATLRWQELANACGRVARELELEARREPSQLVSDCPHSATAA